MFNIQLILPLLILSGCFAPLNIMASSISQNKPLIVSATRISQAIDSTLASSTVITAKDIANSQATSIIELLQRAPNLQILSYGGQGSLSSVAIRGASSSQTLIMIDGQRGFDIQYLDPKQIERIEIIRGSSTSLYGADAIGGIIHIFTKKSGTTQNSIHMSAGNLNTYKLALNSIQTKNDTSSYFNASLFRTQGYNATNHDFYLSPTKNKDDDGYTNKSLSTGFSYDISDKTTLTTRFTHNEGKIEFDGNNNPFTNYNNNLLANTLTYQITSYWNTQLNISYLNNNSIQKDNSFSHTKRLSASLQNDFDVSNTQVFTAGIDYYRDIVNANYQLINQNTNKIKNTRYNLAVFLQTQSHFSFGDVIFSLRHDKNDSYGNNTTGKIAYGLTLSKNIRFTTSLGTAFRAPTFNDLYYPQSGNPNLMPEKAKDFEIALKGKSTHSDWEVVFFHNDITDQIVWGPSTNNSSFYLPFNVAKGQIQGLELIWNTTIKDWHIKSALTLLDPTNKKNQKLIALKSTATLKMSLEKRWKNWFIGTELSTQNKSFTDASNLTSISGFSTVNLTSRYQASKSLSIEAKISNLFNKEYYQMKGYQKEPRMALITINWLF